MALKTWIRNVDGHRFRSVLSRKGPSLSERFGPISFLFDLPSDEAGLAMRLRGWRFCGLPMPLPLGPRIEARETVEEGCFRFDVQASLPFIGKVIHYSGWLERADGRKQALAASADQPGGEGGASGDAGSHQKGAQGSLL